MEAQAARYEQRVAGAQHRARLDAESKLMETRRRAEEASAVALAAGGLTAAEATALRHENAALRREMQEMERRAEEKEAIWSTSAGAGAGAKTPFFGRSRR